jgi:hypothetical protein
VELPCTAEEYFTLCLADNSKFAEDYCAERKDTDLHVEKWCEADKNHRMARMVTYKSLCTSPMCPPDTAVTVWQQAAFSDDKEALVSCPKCCTALLTLAFANIIKSCKHLCIFLLLWPHNLLYSVIG